MHNLLTLNLTEALTTRRLADGATFAEAFARLTEENRDIHARLLSHKDEWPLGWLDLDTRKIDASNSGFLAKKIWEQSWLDTLVVAGIGGSALGAQAVYSGKRKAKEEKHNLIFLDNIDPFQVESFPLNWSHPALNVISKSGTTLETMAGFLSLRSEKFAEAYEGQIVATTDKHKGVLREWADREGWPTLPVPDDVGGRFSVFTPVGLFPLAFAGVDIDALLDGAATWQTSATEDDLLRNEAWQLAALHYLLHTQSTARMAVHYIYGDPLVLLGDWFRQLWAESLAKRNRLDGTVGDGACLTPVVARGTTDQHSQNQLYMEGPDDKVYGFVTCAKWPEDPVVVGEAFMPPKQGAINGSPTFQIPPELEYLRGRTFGELLEACRLGTRDALCELGRPVYEVILPELSERSIGAYMQMWMLATAYAGLLYNVNAFDQPGVERSKQLAMERLKRS